MTSEAEAENLLWSTIRRTFENLEAKAPQGFVPRVSVRLEDGEVIEPGNVEYIGPWLFFELDQPGNEVTGQRRIIAVRPERIGHVEIRMVRSTGGSVGFHATLPSE
jgi:hypothetical protein